MDKVETVQKRLAIDQEGGDAEASNGVATDESSIAPGDITKLMVEVTGSGGGRKYTGLRERQPVPLSGAFVREHFKTWFLDKCVSPINRGSYVRVPIGASEARPTPYGAPLGAACEPLSSGDLDSCPKPVMYRDVKELGFCAPYGLASALNDCGARDSQGGDLGAHLAMCAGKLAKASGKGSGGNDTEAVKACVAAMREAGWPAESFAGRNGFSPTKNVSRRPTLVQLSAQHAVATLEDDDGKRWIYDANEVHALPLTHDNLSRCMGAYQVYKSGSAVRAFRFQPGKHAMSAMKVAREAEASAAKGPAPTLVERSQAGRGLDVCGDISNLSERQPTLVNAATKRCFVCEEMVPISAYTETQLKRATNRKCKDCVQRATVPAKRKGAPTESTEHQPLSAKKQRAVLAHPR